MASRRRFGHRPLHRFKLNRSTFAARRIAQLRSRCLVQANDIPTNTTRDRLSGLPSRGRLTQCDGAPASQRADEKKRAAT
jgi:hypothetical protein